MSRNSVTIIEARPKSFIARLLALWHYRSFYGFLFREITMKKFRDTLLGFWWLAIRPLVPAIIFITLFTAHPVETHSAIPYPIFFMSSYLTWNLFNSTLIFMPRTLLWMQGIMSRTYFPRLLVPFAGFGPPLIEFVVLFVVFILLVGFYTLIGSFPLHMGWQMLWIFPCLILSLTLGIALGMVISVIAIFFKDVVFSISYFAQMFMFLTPVIYPISFIPKSYQWLLYTLNPMATLVEVSRWSLLNNGEFGGRYFFLAALTILLVFVASVTFFMRAETYLADQM